jgi:hypothetical protein
VGVVLVLRHHFGHVPQIYQLVGHETIKLIFLGHCLDSTLPIMGGETHVPQICATSP